MANNKIQFKRTTVSGRVANTTDSSNSQYIYTGEPAVNLTDQKLYISNGSVAFEVGSNASSIKVSGNLTVNSVIANGSAGSANQVLASNGSAVYWTSDNPGAAITASLTEPLYPKAGDMWWNTSSGLLYIYYADANSSQWVQALPNQKGFAGSRGDAGGYTGSVGFAGSTGYSGSTGNIGYSG